MKAKKQAVVSTFTTTFRIFMLMLLCLSALIFVVYQITEINAIAMENDEIREKLKATRISNNRLSKEVNDLKNYNRIESLAEKLDLKPAEKAPYLIVVDGKTVKADLKRIAKDSKPEKKSAGKVMKAGL